MPKMTEAEFDAATRRSDLTFDAATRAEIFGAFGKMEDLIARVTRPKPREAEPALVFVPDQPV